MKKTLIPGLALSALSLAAGNALATTDFYLIAKPVDITMPDSRVVTMWGFAEDAGGACYGTTSGGANSAASKALRMGSAACTGPVATVPGPALTATTGDQNVRIYVTNLLPEPVSVMIPGQEKAWSGNNNGPTWTNGSLGPRGADTTKRVRSFGREAAKDGGRWFYVWNNFRSTNFKSGSYMYHSGTHPALQVQMGLYGQIVQNSAAGEAYPGVAYDNEVTLFYSEVDADLHDDVANGDYGPGQQRTSTIDYNAQYYLVNGEASTATPTPISIGAPGDMTLVRMHNAGYETHVPMLHNLRASVVAEDGGKYPHARDQYAVQVHAMKSKDMLIEAGAPGTYPLYDRMLSVANTDGSHGLMSFLQVAAAAGAPSATNDSFPAIEGGLSGGDVSTNDTPLGGTYTVVSSPVRAAAFTLDPDGTFSYTHDGSETTEDNFVYQVDNGIGVAQASVMLNVAPVNDPPSAAADITATDDGIAVVIAVLNNDSDVDLPGDTLSVSAVGTGPLLAPSDGSVSTDGTTITYTPTTATPPSYTDTFEYELSDGAGGTAVAMVTVDVNEVVAKPNEAPVANADFVGATRNAVDVPLDILANDTDDGVSVLPADFPNVPNADGSVRILGNKVGTAPNGWPLKKTKKGGTVYYDAATGMAVYTPPANFRGTDIFNYKLEDLDGALSNRARVKITVVNP